MPSSSTVSECKKTDGDEDEVYGRDRCHSSGRNQAEPSGIANKPGIDPEVQTESEFHEFRAGQNEDRLSQNPCEPPDLGAAQMKDETDAE